MQLWLVPFKATGTDAFVKKNTDTRASGYEVQTYLYPRNEFPFLTPKKVIYEELVTGSSYYLL